jgi:polyisoprenoid-binding protein YceI
MPPSGTYTVDPIHSSLTFAVRYGGVGRFRAAFEDISGTLDASGSEPRLEGAAKVESLTIKLPPFREHMLSPEFFDLANHPEITFRSTKADLADDGTATVEGELTINGITKPITGKGTWEGPVEGLGGPRVALDLQATIENRFDFGISYDAKLPGGGDAVGPEVTVSLALVLAPTE